MQQQFTATTAAVVTLEFNILSVYLSDMDDNAEEHHFLGFQRTLPGPNADPAEEDNNPADEDEGFFVEYNGQENGRYQRAGQPDNVTLIMAG